MAPLGIPMPPEPPVVRPWVVSVSVWRLSGGDSGGGDGGVAITAVAATECPVPWEGPGPWDPGGWPP